MQGQIDTLGQQQEQLTAAVQGAQGAAEAKNQELAQAQVRLDDLNKELDALKNPGADESGAELPKDDAAIAAKESEIQVQETTVATAKLDLATAQSQLSKATSGL